MVCLDLRSDSPVAKCLSNKLISVIIVTIQLLLWTSFLFTLMARPTVIKEKFPTGGATAYAVVFSLACIAFSVLMLIGLIKDRILYIQMYMGVIIVLIVLAVNELIVNIFIQPQSFGLSGFLSTILGALLHTLTFFIIRNYYLAYTTKIRNQTQNYGQNRVLV